MPYCPKCDMEFIDGITVCSDCGGELVESEEAAKALKAQEEKGHQEQMMAEMARMMEMAARNGAAEVAKQESEDAEWEGDEVSSDGEDAAKAQTPESPIAPARIYINKEQKYEDLKSSASAFLIVGIVLLAAAVACWTGIVSLPLNEVSKIVVQSVITIMGILSIFAAGSSSKSAKTLAPQIEVENRATRDLIQWFADTYTGGELDRAIEDADADADALSPEELSLKRFQLIQDYLITTHDLPDQAYVDALSEEIYGKLYES